MPDSVPLRPWAGLEVFQREAAPQGAGGGHFPQATRTLRSLSCTHPSPRGCAESLSGGQPPAAERPRWGRGRPRGAQPRVPLRVTLLLTAPTLSGTWPRSAQPGFCPACPPTKSRLGPGPDDLVHVCLSESPREAFPPPPPISWFGWSWQDVMQPLGEPPRGW